MLPADDLLVLGYSLSLAEKYCLALNGEFLEDESGLLKSFPPPMGANADNYQVLKYQ